MTRDAAGSTEIETAARFNDRVADYVAYRPGYPPGVVELLRGELGLSAASVVADVGSGTGILSRLLLAEGCTVHGIEPNDAMRAAAEGLLREFPNFRSVKATAEATTLEASSVDLVTAAQAFHWFDADRARAEFRRILRPGGWCVLLWNMRRSDATPFLGDYERLLQEFGTDYREVNCEQVSGERIAAFFPGAYVARGFDNFQPLDFEGLRGRLLSSSFVPLAGQPKYGPMLDALRRVFARHERGGRVTLEYDAKMFFGRLG